MNKSGTTEESGDSVIRFHCKHCQQRVRVPRIHAGKKGKCPKCKNIVVVPKAESAGAAPQTTPSDSAVSSKDAAFALTFLDIPREDKAADQRPAADKTLEGLRELEAEIATDEAEPVPERKLPWLIDIFLYPISAPGLTILAIIVVITLLIDFVTTLFGPFGIFIWALGLVPNVVLFLYMYWYLCRCIHDSAEGGLRSPDVLVDAPSLGDMGWQTIRIAGCLAFFCVPAFFYHRHTERTDTVFWCLLVYAAFFFPMGLLAVIMFDSFSGLNPLLLIGSIFSTFFQYCGLILLYCTFGYLFAKIISVLPQSGFSNYIPVTVILYLLMVAAHLLGRFYFRYKEKLYWEV